MEDPILNTKLADIEKKAERGERLSDADALSMLASNDLCALGRAAHTVRLRKAPPDIVTYAVDRNINYTNVCSVRCRFCAFSRDPGAEDAYVLDRAALFAKIEETLAAGGTQILLQGGINESLGLDWFTALFRDMKANFDIHLHGLSPCEIAHLSRREGLTHKEVIAALVDAGLDTIPGGGAEILSERVREEISPKKCTAGEWLAVTRAAHDLELRTTATMMFGHVETYEDRVEHLSRLREIQDETGGFTAFIAWTFQKENTELSHLNPVGAFGYLKMLAVARCYLDNFDNFQASWVTQGPAIAQLSLFFGANDLGSTMLEENVVREAGASFMLSENELRQIAADAGFRPVKRDTLYRPLEEI